MIVGHSRITNTSASKSNIRNYLKSENENEKVVTLYDDYTENAFFKLVNKLSDAYEARGKELKYSLRHFYISPDEELSCKDVKTLEEVVRQTYGIDDELPVLISEHHKDKEGVGRVCHYHFLFPEVQLGGRKQITDRSSQFKNAFIGRKCEALFEHGITPSPHNKKIAEILRKDSTRLAERVAEASNIKLQPKPSKGTKRACERLKIDSNFLSKRLHDIQNWSGTRKQKALAIILEEQGLHLTRGTKTGRGQKSVMVAKMNKDGKEEIVGTLARVANIKKAYADEFNPDNFKPDLIKEIVENERRKHSDKIRQDTELDRAADAERGQRTHNGCGDAFKTNPQLSSNATKSEPNAVGTTGSNKSIIERFSDGIRSGLGNLRNLIASASLSKSRACSGFIGHIAAAPSAGFGIGLRISPNMTQEQKIKALQDFSMNWKPPNAPNYSP